VNAKVYLSDEGYGHIVRQRAIMTEIEKSCSDIDFTLQTHKHLAFAKQIISASTFIDKYNNVSWHKQEDSSPHIDSIRSHYEQYLPALDTYLAEEKIDFEYDFVLSDFVYEAFEVAHLKKTPSFGVAHFTWDWFFSKIYPRVISDALFKYFTETAQKARKLYFPPFTPPEILKFYAKTAVQVPLIVRDDISHKSWPIGTDKRKILIMDSGAGLMSNYIKDALLDKLPQEWLFGVQESLGIRGDAIFNIPTDHLLIDYVQEADLIVGRPGFNTISECIAYRKPMLLISESMNPEMEFNIAELKKLRLGGFLSLQDFRTNFIPVLSAFFSEEYNMIEKNMLQHSFETNGGRIIAEDILSSL
jgi:hypothetical protein